MSERGLPVPKINKGVATRYALIPQTIWDNLPYASADDHIRDAMVPFLRCKAEEVLELELIETPTLIKPDDGVFITSHCFKVRIAEGRQRLGAWLCKHFKHNWEVEDFGEDLAFCCYDCGGDSLEISLESLTGITF